MRTVLAVVVLANVVCAGWLGTADRMGDAASSAPPPLDENIRLLSERVEVAALPESPTPELSASVEVVTEIETPAVARACVALGPFERIERVNAVKATVEAEGGRAEVVEESVDLAPDYLVYIPSPGSRANARRMLEELTGQRVEGHIIAGGERKNALSVGVFTRERLAQAQRTRVARLGYEVQMVALPRQSTVYRLVADRVVPGLGEAEVAGCDAIASDIRIL